MSFRDRLNMSIPELAKLVNADRSWIYRVIEGDAACGKRTALKIEAATEGAIKAVWLLGLEAPPPHPQPSSLDPAV